MTRVTIGPALVPRAADAPKPSLRIFALICCFLVALILWSLIILFISRCARVQPACADCYIELQNSEQAR